MLSFSMGGTTASSSHTPLLATCRTFVLRAWRPRTMRRNVRSLGRRKKLSVTEIGTPPCPCIE